MRNFIFSLCFIFISVCCSVVAADDLKLIAEQSAKLKMELRYIEDIEPGSPRCKEIGTLLKDFEATAVRLQKNVRKLPYMDDIRCGDCAKNMKSAAQSAIGMHKSLLNAKPSEHLIIRRLTPGQAMALIEGDIKAMEEVQFSPVKMTVNASTQELCWLQFIRCYTFCKKARGNIKKNIKIPVWKEICLERLTIAGNLADKMTPRLLSQYGAKIDYIRLNDEFVKYRSELLRVASEGDIVTLDDRRRKTTSAFLKAEERYRLEESKGKSDPVSRIDFVIRTVKKEKENAKKLAEKEKREKEKAELAAEKARIKEEKRLKREAEKQKAQAEKEQKKREQEAASAATAASVKEKNGAQSLARALNRASDAELSAELAKVYEKYFPQDDQRALTESQKKECLDRLSVKQKQLFDSTRSRLAREGVPEKDLDLETLKEIRPMLSSRNHQPDRKAAIELILKEKAGK